MFASRKEISRGIESVLRFATRQRDGVFDWVAWKSIQRQAASRAAHHKLPEKAPPKRHWL